MPISLPPLPYPAAALEPHVSRRTLERHHGAHHRDYVDKTNKAIAGTTLADAELNDIVQAARGDDRLFNPASQAWNHGFYWNSLTAEPSEPAGRLQEAIERDFGSLAAVKERLLQLAVGHFGSGWVWLVAEDNQLSVISTHDAHSPFSEGSGNPLLTMDVWEHAYYLDVQNDRAAYVKAVLDNCLNWRFASENFGRGCAWRYPSAPAQEPRQAFEAAR